MVSATEPAQVAIEVPHVEDMTEGQLRGHFCAWCAIPLRLDRSVDLGERIGEDGYHWYPRSCPPCAVAHLHRQLLDHAGSCEQCADDASLCAPSLTLRTALREGRRL